MFELHTKNIKEKVTLSQLPSLRQSFIAASTLIAVGVGLGHYVHSGYLFIALLVAGGLMFSGIVGFCPMALIVQKMPWNKSAVDVTESK